MFPHESLDVYRLAGDFVAQADHLAAQLPRGRAYLVDQLRRASLSIQANIAEGAGEFSRPDKARFYRMALRSGAECAALLDVCERLQLSDSPFVSEAKETLRHVMAMLTVMVRNLG